MQNRVHLLRDDERVSEVDLLADALGGRAGLDGVLGHLNRAAVRRPVPGRGVAWGFSLDVRDSIALRWWPQGITSSADSGDGEEHSGRKVVVTSSYAKTVRGVNKGSRLTFFDVTEPHRVRYRHVLLVEALVQDGVVTFKPVRIHAGGIVWHGPYMHVAGTSRGLFSFRLDDIMRLPKRAPDDALGRQPDGTFAGFGHRYVLPVRFKYAAVTDEGFEGIRYSFLSLDRSGPQHTMVAGEYGRGGQTTRLISYEMDPSTGLVLTDEANTSRPLSLDLGGVHQMQGAVSVGGRLYVTQSRGRSRRGSLWVGRPSELTEHRRALPPGPEDICYWPSTGLLWSVSEHPLLRFVYALDRASFD